MMIGAIIGRVSVPFDVTRTNEATTFVAGLAQIPDDVDTFEARGSVQQMSGRERLVLPELIRDRETLKIYTQCELRPVDVAGETRADRIDYEGDRYVVHSVKNWEAVGGFYRAIIVKEND